MIKILWLIGLNGDNMLNLKELKIDANNEDSIIDTYIILKLKGVKVTWREYLKEIGFKGDK